MPNKSLMDWGEAATSAYSGGSGGGGGGGFWEGLGSLFSSGGGDSGGSFASSGWGMLAQGILSGIGSSSRGKDERRARREELELLRQTQLENTRTQGDENRRTIDFERRMAESERLNERARLARAWGNWATTPATETTKPVASPDFREYYVAPPQAKIKGKS